MGLIKKFFEDKGRVGVAIVCLLMLSITMVSAMTGESLAASTYTVTFDAQGGTPSKTSMIVLAGATSTYGSADSLATATRSGYDFVGWYSSSGCSGTKVTSSTILIKQADHKLYACWDSTDDEIKVKVNFDARGGTITTTTKTVTYGENYGSLPLPTKTGYTYQGWYTATSGGSKVESSTKVSNSKEHTLYARWSAKEYTVIFDSNGGSTPNPSTINVTYGGIYGTVPIVTREGYKLDGWYTSGGTFVGPAHEVTIASNHTLYAHWTPNEYTISFNANGGSGAPSSQTKKHGTNLTLSSTIPTRAGYEFLGWSTSSSATTATYKAGGTYTANTSATLHAVWKLASYKITFDGNEGTPSKTEMEIKVGATTYGTLPTATRDGYNFVGWFSAKEGGTKVTASSTLLIGAPHTLYAQWEKSDIIYIFLNANGGTCSTTSLKFEGKGNHTLSLPVPSRDGYSFDGWYTEASGGTKIISGPTYLSSSTTFYAHWTVQNYKVTFDSLEGKLISSTLNVTYGQKYGTLPTTERTGYKFVGWYDQKTGGSQITSESIVNKTSNHTLYARWQVLNVTVVFNQNGGGTPTMSTKTVTYGSAYGTLPTVSRSGYGFDGWALKVDDCETRKFIESTSTVTTPSSHELYACWSLKSDSKVVDITFDANGGKWSNNGNSTLTLSNNLVGDYYKVPSNNPVRQGYVFAGWYTEKDKGVLKTSTVKITNTSSHTLYAHWTMSTYGTFEITFNGNGGTPEETKKQISPNCSTYNACITLPIPERSGYEFDGWYTDASNGNKIIGSSMLVKQGDHTLYAHWTKKSTTTTTYTISYNANGGSGAPSSQTKTKGKVLTLRTGVPIRGGYKFLGWSKSSTATSVTYQPGGTYSTDANATLYAVWEANKYTVTYNANGGSGTMASSDYTYGVAKELNANTFVKEGHTFKGWNTKSDGTGMNYTDKQSVTISESLTLYAQWSSNDSSGGGTGNGGTGNTGENVITYIVRYNANGGTGTMKDDEHVYNFAKSLTKNTFTRTGYKFNGWNTKADGTGTSYADGETVGNLTSTKGKVVTLYAQWVLNIISGDGGETGEGGTDDGGTEDGGTGSGENNEYPTVSLTLDKAYETKLDLAINVSNITDADNAECDIYLIPMEGTGFSTGASKIIDTIKKCKNGKNLSTITDLQPDTKYTFQVVLRTEQGSIVGEEYVTFKTEPKKSIIENITESPQTGMLATILVSIIGIGALGGVIYYRKKIKV